MLTVVVAFTHQVVQTSIMEPTWTSYFPSSSLNVKERRTSVSFLQHDVLRLFVLVPAVLAVLSTLPVGRVQPGPLEQPGHEGQTLSPDVGLSGKEVEHWVGTAAHEGDGGGDGAAPLPYFAQSGWRDKAEGHTQEE